MPDGVFDRYIMRRSGLYRSFFEAKTNQTQWHASSGGSTESLTEEYFAQITTKNYQDLVHFYEGDLDAFGFNPKIYDLGFDEGSH